MNLGKSLTYSTELLLVINVLYYSTEILLLYKTTIFLIDDPLPPQENIELWKGERYYTAQLSPSL